MERRQEELGADPDHPLPSQEGRQKRYKPVQAQHWDEIRIVTNPRYKTSDLSGKSLRWFWSFLMFSQ
jgi:hypothetical protein